MKQKICTITTLFILLSATFSQSIFTQTAKKQVKVLTQDERNASVFVESFLKNYFETFDLTKVPSKFFVNNFKTLNTMPFYISDYDSLLTDDEKFQNGVLMIDFFSALIFSELKKVNYDMKRLEKVFTDDFMEMKLDNLFKDHAKGKIFLHKENFNQIKNVSDFRESINDFKQVLENLRNSTLNSKPTRENKKSNTFNAKKTKLFTLKKIRDCLDEECEGFPVKTKVAEINITTFYLFIVKDNGQWKIMRLFPIGD